MGMHERVQVHEETVKYLKTVCEKDENRSRQLLDRVEHSAWDVRIRELQSGFRDLDQHKIEQSEMLELLQRRLDSTERTLQDASMKMRVDELFPDDVHCLDAMQLQLESMQDEIKQISDRTKVVEESSELASRVGSLVTQLTHVAPKVIQQQKNMGEMIEHIDQMDDQIKRLCVAVGFTQGVTE